jgi:hypothetical protein
VRTTGYFGVKKGVREIGVDGENPVCSFDI